MAEKKSPKKAVKAGAKKAKTGTKKRVTFRYHSPDANQVFVAGSFNDWNPTARPLKKNASGMWLAMVTLDPGLYEYRFVADGNWVDDPLAQERRRNEHGTQNCVFRVY